MLRNQVQLGSSSLFNNFIPIHWCQRKLAVKNPITCLLNINKRSDPVSHHLVTTPDDGCPYFKLKVVVIYNREVAAEIF